MRTLGNNERAPCEICQQMNRQKKSRPLQSWKRIIVLSIFVYFANSGAFSNIQVSLFLLKAFDAPPNKNCKSTACSSRETCINSWSMRKTPLFSITKFFHREEFVQLFANVVEYCRFEFFYLQLYIICFESVSCRRYHFLGSILMA